MNIDKKSQKTKYKKKILISDDLKSEDLVEIGKRLRKFRVDLGMKQKAFANILDLHSSYISEIEQGKTNPGLGVLLRMHREFNLSLDWLLFNDGEMLSGSALTGRGRALDLDFGMDHDRVMYIINEMKKSPILRHMMIAQYFSIINDHGTRIKSEIEKVEIKKSTD